MDVVRASNLTKVYGGQRGIAPVRALDAFDLTVSAGEFVGIMGPSGSGKTTLLQILGSIDRPTSGEAIVAGQDLGSLRGRELAQFRSRKLGFIFQEYNLLDFLTLRENIVLPLALAGRPEAEIEQRVDAIAREIGILDVLSHHPYEVSGGQKQRAAAARALVHQPALVLADEPTGNLDSRSARALMETLNNLNRDDKVTIVMVTHDPVTASYCRRIIFIKDGRPFTDLRRGEDRGAFLQRILDVVATMGGDGHAAVTGS
ncbi:MAG: ABC transporter ATP-binding protein [Chloroflexota bacterium]